MHATSGRSVTDDARSADDGGDVFAQIGRTTVQLQQEGLQATRQWSDSVLHMLEEQADQQRSVMQALTSSLEAMEQALVSQERTNRALRESLEAYREVIDGARDTQRQTADLLRASLGNVVSVQQQQLEAARAVLQSATVPRESVTRMMDQWISAYRSLFEAFLPTGRSGRGG